MRKDADRTNAKKNEIIKAALELFFEKGYEGTSIRMIQKKVNKEVGLFYYYFKNKDEVFEKAVDMFFENYEIDIELIVTSAEKEPKLALKRFFEYMECETEKFRNKYSDKLHWTVRKAIREHTLQTIEPYLKRIIEILVKNGLKPRLEISVASMMLTHGIGSIILHTKTKDYISRKPEMIKAVNLIMGVDSEEYIKMISE